MTAAPGTGKSHIAQALGYQAIKAGMTVFYRSIFDVVRDFLHDEAFDGNEKVLAKYLKPDLVIIDDMGMKQLPKRSGEYLFEIIMRRHEVRSTIMTSNRPLEDWGEADRRRPRRHRHPGSIPGACRVDHRDGQELSSAEQGRLQAQRIQRGQRTQRSQKQQTTPRPEKVLRRRQRMKYKKRNLTGRF